MSIVLSFSITEYYFLVFLSKNMQVMLGEFYASIGKATKDSHILHSVQAIGTFLNFSNKVDLLNEPQLLSLSVSLCLCVHIYILIYMSLYMCQKRGNRHYLWLWSVD